MTTIKLTEVYRTVRATLLAHGYSDVSYCVEIDWWHYGSQNEPSPAYTIYVAWPGEPTHFEGKSFDEAMEAVVRAINQRTAPTPPMTGALPDVTVEVS